MESITQSIYHISKDNFVVLYKEARKALSYTNTHSGFAASGLVPLNPQRVLDKLTVKLTPPSTFHGMCYEIGGLISNWLSTLVIK